MVCIGNFYSTFTVLACVLLFLYFFVCLPDNPLVFKISLVLLLSFLVYGLVGAFAPGYVPTQPLTVALTYLSLMIFFSFLASGFSESFLLLVLVGVIFVLPVAAYNNLSAWVELNSGLVLSNNEVLVLLLGLLILGGSLLYYFQHSHLAWDILKTLFFAFLAMFGFRIIQILIDYNSPDQFCCSSSEGYDTCPIYFDIVYWLLFPILILLRFTMMQYWRDIRQRCCFKKRKKEKEEEEQLLISYSR